MNNTEQLHIELAIESEADKRFNKFHKENPEVYESLEQLAFQAYHKGRKKIGIQMLMEVFRWNKIIQTKGNDYKINNNFGSRYARLIMKNNPSLDGLFETREMKS